jgi:hypothetical protein
MDKDLWLASALQKQVKEENEREEIQEYDDVESHSNE